MPAHRLAPLPEKPGTIAMTYSIFRVLLATTLLAPMSLVYAHEPSPHAKPIQRVDCSALKESVQSNVDETDPVAMAILRRCATNDSQAGQNGKQVISETPENPATTDVETTALQH
jgi:hypothetical protein